MEVSKLNFKEYAPGVKDQVFKVINKNAISESNVQNLIKGLNQVNSALGTPDVFTQEKFEVWNRGVDCCGPEEGHSPTSAQFDELRCRLESFIAGAQMVFTVPTGTANPQLVNNTVTGGMKCTTAEDSSEEIMMTILEIKQSISKLLKAAKFQKRHLRAKIYNYGKQLCLTAGDDDLDSHRILIDLQEEGTWRVYFALSAGTCKIKERNSWADLPKETGIKIAGVLRSVKEEFEHKDRIETFIALLMGSETA